MALNIKSKKLLILFLILAIAAFFRLRQLDSTPPGLYPDVAMNGNDVLESLKTGHFKLFYPANNGREGLFMWMVGASFFIFGVSVWSIKIVAATLGILTVFGLYLLTKEILQNTRYKIQAENIALLSSFFLAVSFWHVNFSRIGFRAILLPFILVFSFYFLFKGLNLLRQKVSLSIGYSLLSGLFFGLGFYTYTSFRVSPAVLILLLVPCLFIAKKEGFFKKYLLFVAIFLFFVFIVALPLGIYFLNNRQDFISRAAPISIFAAASPFLELIKSAALHLAMFNVRGDMNWRHNFAGSPMLFWPVGILFLIGIFCSVKEWFVSLKNKDYLSATVFIFTLSLLFVMLLPSILTYEGIPHSLRTIGTIPAVFILVGMGAWWLYEKLERSFKNKKILIAVSIILLLMVESWEFYKYFYLWGKNPRVAEAFTVTYSDIGNYLNSLSDNVQKYVIVNEPGSPLYGISIPGQTPLFIESAKFGKPRAEYITFENLDSIKMGLEGTIIIPLYDGRTLAELEKRFPQGNKEEFKTFWVYKIPNKLILDL